MTNPIAASQAIAALYWLQRKTLASLVAEGHSPLDHEYKDYLDGINTIRTYVSQQEERVLRLSNALFEIRKCTNVVTDS